MEPDQDPILRRVALRRCIRKGRLKAVWLATCVGLCAGAVRDVPWLLNTIIALGVFAVGAVWLHERFFFGQLDLLPEPEPNE